MRFSAASGGLMVGMHQFPRPMLAAYREAVLDKKLGVELEKALASVQQAGDYRIGGEHYKRVPRGFPADHARADLLRYDALYVSAPELSVTELTSPELVDICYDHFARLAPVQRWLVKINPA